MEIANLLLNLFSRILYDKIADLSRVLDKELHELIKYIDGKKQFDLRYLLLIEVLIEVSLCMFVRVDQKA
jgi:hypothetical protein